MMQAPGRMIQVGDQRLHVVVTGGGPVVVLCGGLGGNWFDWDDVTRILSPFHTVVNFDRPGFGLSDPLPREETPTVQAEADRILGVLDALDLNTRAAVVGHSIAGFYAEGFARLYPDRTSGILLLDSSAERDPRGLIPRRARIAGAHALGRAGAASGMQYLLGTTVRRVLNQSIPPDGITQENYDWVREIYRTPSYLDAALVEDLVYPDMALELNRIRRRTHMPDVPVTVAAAHTGRRSPWAGAWIAKQKRLAAYLDARFTVVKPAHHHAMIDQPGSVAALIAELV